MAKVLFTFSLILCAIASLSSAVPYLNLKEKETILDDHFGLFLTTNKDLLNGANLNNLIVSGTRLLKPNEALGNGWVVGNRHNGVYVIDSSSDYFPVAPPPGGVNIRTAVELCVDDEPGSIYYPLGQLTQGKRYYINWFDTVNHHQNNNDADHYTVRVSVDFSENINDKSGGIESKFGTSVGWTHRQMTFTPTANDYFYLSFIGIQSSIHRGAIISMVNVTDESPDPIPTTVTIRTTPTTPSTTTTPRITYKDLLNGHNLNDLSVSRERQVKPNENLGNGWVVGNYNQGVFVCDSTDDGFPPGDNSMGIRTAVRMNVENNGGSIYYPLGLLNPSKTYTITWYDSVNYHKGNSAADKYSIRIAVNFQGDSYLKSGGMESHFVTGYSWTRRQMTFSPSASDYFYLSFKGQVSPIKRGALISMVKFIETVV